MWPKKFKLHSSPHRGFGRGLKKNFDNLMWGWRKR